MEFLDVILGRLLLVANLIGYSQFYGCVTLSVTKSMGYVISFEAQRVMRMECVMASFSMHGLIGAAHGSPMHELLSTRTLVGAGRDLSLWSFGDALRSLDGHRPGIRMLVSRMRRLPVTSKSFQGF